MIKVRPSFNELNEFSKYLLESLLNEAKTTDLIREYFLADAIDSLHRRCKHKLFAAENGKKTDKPILLSIENRELLALSIYFKRYQAHNFLLKLENSVLAQLPTELVKVITHQQQQQHEISEEHF